MGLYTSPEKKTIVFLFHSKRANVGPFPIKFSQKRPTWAFTHCLKINITERKLCCHPSSPYTITDNSSFLWCAASELSKKTPNKALVILAPLAVTAVKLNMTRVTVCWRKKIKGRKKRRKKRGYISYVADMVRDYFYNAPTAAGPERSEGRRRGWKKIFGAFWKLKCRLWKKWIPPRWPNSRLNKFGQIW